MIQICILETYSEEIKVIEERRALESRVNRVRLGCSSALMGMKMCRRDATRTQR